MIAVEGRRKHEVDGQRVLEDTRESLDEVSSIVCVHLIPSILPATMFRWICEVPE